MLSRPINEGSFQHIAWHFFLHMEALLSFVYDATTIWGPREATPGISTDMRPFLASCVVCDARVSREPTASYTVPRPNSQFDDFPDVVQQI